MEYLRRSDLILIHNLNFPNNFRKKVRRESSRRAFSLILTVSGGFQQLQEMAHALFFGLQVVFGGG